MWNKGPAVIVVQWVMFGLATFAVAVRIGACKRPEYGFWWDDFVIFFSLAVFLGTCVTGNIALAWGCGKFSNDVNPYILPKATLMGIIATDLGMLADAIPKIGVALLIIRLFHPKRWTKWTMIAVTVLCVIFNILLVIFSFIQCQPAAYQWNRDTMDGTCWNIDVYTDFAFFTGAWTAAIDFFFSLYPLVVVSQLRMQWRKKLAVMATMSFGFGTFAVTTYKVATQYSKFLHAAYDATRVLSDIMLWNALGIGFTIIAGSIPTFGWVFHTRRWKLFVGWITGGSISTSTSRRTSGTNEKWPFVIPTQSQRETPATSGPPSHNEVPMTVPEEGPLTFPQRAHHSGRSFATTFTWSSSGRSNSSASSRLSSRIASRIQSRVQSPRQPSQLQRQQPPATNEQRQVRQQHCQSQQPQSRVPANALGSPMQRRARSQPMPFDSIQQLERSTYMS